MACGSGGKSVGAGGLPRAAGFEGWEAADCAAATVWAMDVGSGGSWSAMLDDMGVRVRMMVLMWV